MKNKIYDQIKHPNKKIKLKLKQVSLKLIPFIYTINSKIESRSDKITSRITPTIILTLKTILTIAIKATIYDKLDDRDENNNNNNRNNNNNNGNNLIIKNSHKN